MSGGELEHGRAAATLPERYDTNKQTSTHIHNKYYEQQLQQMLHAGQ